MKPKLLFVCGFPGGGTDLTKTILNAHPDIYLNGEMPLLPRLSDEGYVATSSFTNAEQLTAFQSKLSRLDTLGNMENISHDFRSQIAQRGSLQMEQVLRTCFSDKQKYLWGNKTPQNTEHIHILARLFPNARFLVVVRDARDVCLSCRRKWGKDMVWCASKWNERMLRGRTATQELEEWRSLFIRFEDVLRRTEYVCRQVCDFLEMRFSRRMLEHHKYTSEIIEGKLNYGRPIIHQNYSKWSETLKSKQVKRIEEIAFVALKEFDYNVSLASEARPITAFEKYRGFVRDSLNLVLVGNRASRSNSTTQRLKNANRQIKRILQGKRRKK